jgi:membrane-bound metal-dependent hydrolase YbcI (DUF457 family)
MVGSCGITRSDSGDERAIAPASGRLHLGRRNAIRILPSDTTPVSRGQLWLYFFLATASHGVLDAFTNGGLGVAFFAPFHNARYFFPVTPIEVSPISVRAFFTARGARVMASELIWIWLPAIGFAAATLWLRSRRGRG